MVRKIILAVLCALVGLPLSVYGIGLGEIKTQSALNQNFKGEIQLLSVPRGELDTMRVKLASREAFAKVGSEYAPVLSRLKFEPVRRKDGSAVILVTSREVIREPFLDFLVEVNWPNGRLVKEYTVLLDPPATTKRRPARISKPRVSTKKKLAADRAAAPVKRASTQTKAQPLPGAADFYGPVASNETAWKIAAKLRPEGVSIHQTMMALLHNNQQAFVDNNVNILKKGSMLAVPSIEEIQAISGQDAIDSFERQADDWQPNTTKTAAAPAKVDSTPDTDAAAPGKESKPVEVEEDSARLQIAAASLKDSGEAEAGESDTAAQDGDEDLRHELMLARENMETARLQTEEFKATVKDMEKQLQDMTRLLNLQDVQLAQLRARVASAADDPAGSGDEPAVSGDDSQDALLAETRPESDTTPGQEQEAGEAAEKAGMGEPGAAEDVALAGTETAAIMATEEAKGLETDTTAESPLELGTSTAAQESVELDASTAEQESVELESGTAAEQSAEPDTSTAAEDAVELETTIAAVEPVEPATGNPAADPVMPDTGTEAENPVEKVADNNRQSSWLKDNLSMIAAAAGGLFGVGVLTALVRGRKKQPLTEAIVRADKDVSSDSGDDKTESNSQPHVDQDEPPAKGVYVATGAPAMGQDETEVDALAAADVYIAYSRYDEAQKTLEDEIAAGDKSVPIRHKLMEVYFATENVQNFVELADSMVKDGQDKEDAQAWEHIREMGKKLDKFNPLFWSPGAMSTVVEENELGLDFNSGEGQDDTESPGGLDDLDLDIASFGTQTDNQADDSELGTIAVETELDTELADLTELDDVVQAEATPGRGENDEEIRFAEPLQDIELGDDMDTKLDLARAYIEMGDDEAAAGILREVLEQGSSEQMHSASELLSGLKT